MQKRARRRDLEAVPAMGGDDRLQAIDDAGQVGAPDIAAVDDAQRQDEVLGRLGEDRRELFRRADQVEVQAGHRQRHGEVEVFLQAAEIAGDQNLQPGHVLGEAGIGLLQRRGGRDIAVERQDGLVQLHPIGAGIAQALQHLDIDGNQPVDKRQRIEAVIMALAEAQEGHRANHDRTGVVAQRLGLAERVERLVGSQVEGLVLREFRHHVVVVGVEPLGHFLGGYTMSMVSVAVRADLELDVLLRSSGHGEIGVEIGLGAVARRNGADHEADVEDLIVEREIVRRNDIDAARLLAFPIGQAQILGDLQQIGLAGFARPVAFEGEFQFALQADARRPQGGDGKVSMWHDGPLSMRGAGHAGSRRR